MKIAFALAVCCAANVAEAGHHCTEVSNVVGYQQCHRFGSWANGVGMWFELGAVALRFDPGPIEGTTADGKTVTTAPGDGRAVKARGIRFRHTASFGAWYFGSEFDFASITDGPQLVTDESARDSGSSGESGTQGFVVETKFALGRHARFGPMMFGAEVAPGARIAGYWTGASDIINNTAQAWFVFEAQVRADVWLAPNFTLGATAGVDLMDTHDVTFAISLAAHLVPYDHTR